MDTHRENTHSNKTKALNNNINMRIWEVGTVNEPFIRGSYAEIKFSKNCYFKSSFRS